MSKNSDGLGHRKRRSYEKKMRHVTCFLHGCSFLSISRDIDVQGTKLFKYCTCPEGRVTYNFTCPANTIMHLSFKSICNIEHKGVICNMTSSSNSFQRTPPTGRVLWEELLVFSRFHL